MLDQQPMDAGQPAPRQPPLPVRDHERLPRRRPPPVTQCPKKHPLPIVDNWLHELFFGDNIEDTTTHERSQQTPQATADELEAGASSRDRYTGLANDRVGLKAAPSGTLAGWARETEAAEPPNSASATSARAKA